MSETVIKMLVNPPDLEEHKSYADFKVSVEAWQGITSVPEDQQGAVLAYNLSDESKFGPDLRKHVYHKHKPTTLKGNADGVNKVIAVLDTYLESTGMAKAAENWDKFIDIARKGGQTIKQYVGHYEQICQEYQDTIGTLTPFAKALHLLRTAKLSDVQYEMILAMCEGDQAAQANDQIYEKIKKAVICQLSDKLNEIRGKTREVNNEASAFIAESDDDDDVIHAKDVLAASFYKKQAWKKKQHFQQQHKQNSGAKPQSNYQTGSYKPHNQEKQKNQNTDSEERCFFCRSKTHGLKDCIQAKKMRNQYFNRRRNAGAYVTETKQSVQEEEDHTGNDSNNEDNQPGNIFLSDNLALPKQPETRRFREEAENCAALDTCCTQTVAGKIWNNKYIASLPKELKQQVIGPLTANKVFRFGNNQHLKATERWMLPVFLGSKLTTIEVYIIPSDIPMLMSKQDLADNNAILYMKEDKAEINGKLVHLKTTTAGHFIVNLLRDEEKHDIFIAADVLATDLLNADSQTQLKELNKLHKQFGHRPKQAFVDLLKHSNAWHPTFSAMLDKIIDGCEGCIIRKRNPDKPAVAMMMAKDTNETVAMDLKKLKNGKHILYIIDAFSRFTVAKIIPRKKPEEVIDALMEKWVSIFGTPTKFLTDNGGEFSNEEMVLVTNKLNIYHNTTGAESPWQNGLCEKNHATVDNILEALEKDYPRIPLETLLLWACVAKNSLLMVQGFSPYQLMFGKNPKLPNIITDPLPTWDNEGIPACLSKHLDAMKATKEAFIKSEDSKKLKLALEAKVRTNNQTYVTGDRVYFKRAGYNKWFNGRVVCQDGKIIFVRYGSYLYRVSANRIIKAGTELSKALDQEENDDNDDNASDNNDDNETEQNHIAKLIANTSSTTKEQLPTVSPPSNTSTPISEKTNSLTSTRNDQANDSYPTTPILHQESQDSNPMIETANSQESNHMRKRNISDSLTPDIQNENTSQTENNNSLTIPNTSQTSTESQCRPEPEKTIPLKLSANDLVECKIAGKWIPGVILKKAGKATGIHKNWYNIAFENGEKISVNTEEIETRKTTSESLLAMWVHDEVMATILSPEKNKSPECIKAKIAELEKLKEFDTYEIVDDIGQEAISTTWVLTEKEGNIRARLTARGFEEESNVRSDSPTVESASMRFLLTITALKKWELRTTDIKSAFLQGQVLDREVFIKPPREANCPGKLWKLYKCLYGLNDASKKWYDEMERRFDELGFIKSCQDEALFIYKKEDGTLIGMIALHVDDFMHTGTKHFSEVIMPELLKGLVVGSTDTGEFTYTGFHIKQDEEGITLDQNNYLDTILIPKLDAKRLKHPKSPLRPAETTILRQIMGKVNWVIRATRPDLAFDMVYISTRFHRGTIQDVKDASNLISKMQKNQATIRIPDLEDEDGLEIWAFSDASHGTVDDKDGSVAAHVIFLANKSTGKAAPVAWRAAKVKRIAISTHEAESLALQEALNTAIAVQQLTEECLNYSVPIIGVVDNYSSYETVKSYKKVKSPRLHREISSIKQMQKQLHVDKIMWLQGSLMIADCMTKKGKPGYDLLEALQSGYLGESMNAANASEFIMTYDPKQDTEIGQYIPKW